MPVINESKFESARAAYTRFAIQSAARLAKEVGFSYEPASVAPDTYEKVQAEYAECSQSHRGFRVWNGACDNVVFTNAEGNYAFRFWHDVVSHGAGKLAFDTSDEVKAGMMWVRKVAAEFGSQSLECQIAYADTVGQTLYCDKHGDFPVDQLGFVRDYVAGKSIVDVQCTLEGIR